VGKDSYSADQIQILEGLEPVRRRPGMYIGSTDLRGLHHLVVELVDNSIDEALAGWCDTIRIVLHADKSVSVLDNGRGIPVGMHPTARKSALEVVLTTLHAGGKFGGGGYKVSGGLHGVGLSVVNALSERLVVEVYGDGETHHQEYTRGVPNGPVTVIGKSDRRGTYVRFWPDPEIFQEIEFSWDTVCTSLRSYAFLNKGITIQLTDERDAQAYTFHFEGGIQSFVRYLNANRNVINQKPMYVEREIDGNVVEIALPTTCTPRRAAHTSPVSAAR
jgi:DNA gyrase subunit B